MTDWIEWNGGECPVSDSALVCVKLRVEVEADVRSEWGETTIAGVMDWSHSSTEPDTDIVEYRIEDDD